MTHWCRFAGRGGSELPPCTLAGCDGAAALIAPSIDGLNRSRSKSGKCAPHWSVTSTRALPSRLSRTPGAVDAEIVGGHGTSSSTAGADMILPPCRPRSDHEGEVSDRFAEASLLSQGAQKGRSSLVETRVRGVSIASQLPGAVPSAVPIPRSIPAVSCCAQAAITCRSPRSAGAVYPSQTLPVLARRRRRWRWRPQATAAIPPARPQRRPTRGQTHQLGAAHGRRARLRARRACVRVSAPVWSGAWTQMWRRLPDLKSRRLLLTMQDGGENFGRRRQGRRRGRRRVALPLSICASPPEHAGDGPLLSVGLTAAASTGTQAAAIRSLASAASVSDIPVVGMLDVRAPARGDRRHHRREPCYGRALQRCLRFVRRADCARRAFGSDRRRMAETQSARCEARARRREFMASPRRVNCKWRVAGIVQG